MILEPNYLRSLDIKVLKKQFTKSRGKMQKRKERLDKAGFETGFQTFVDNWNQSGKIPTITAIREATGDNETQMKNNMIYIIAELERYAEDQRTLLSYQMEQRRELVYQLNESGYDTIDIKNVQKFVKFLEWIHSSNLDHMLYIETYEESEKGYGRSKRRERTEEEKKRVLEMFELWKDNEEYLPEELLKEYL